MPGSVSNIQGVVAIFLSTALTRSSSVWVRGDGLTEAGTVEEGADGLGLNDALQDEALAVEEGFGGTEQGVREPRDVFFPVLQALARGRPLGLRV